MSDVDFVTLDVFTAARFEGNPLLVVPDARGLSAAEMQLVAREINYSESTFVLPPSDPANAYLQRTFVPVKEIPYAGHPTVGTAFAMAERGAFGPLDDGVHVRRVEVGFGPIALEIHVAGGAVTRVRMEQGAPRWEAPLDGAEHERIARALGAGAHGALPGQVVSTGNRFLMLPVGDVAELSRARLDTRTIAEVSEAHDVLGIYLFARDGADVRARCFCPDAGVPEDPATGSAAGPLGIYLALHDALPAPSFVVHQGIEMGRRSRIDVDVTREPLGVRVAGSAVPVMRGTLRVR